MKEIFTMWRYTKMVVLTSLTAAFFVAILVPFKAIVIVPGLTELRPASVIPVVFGILFGPAGAWGSAIGNVIGDFFGTLGPGSLFGFFGNFFYALVGYKIWGRRALSSEKAIAGNLKFSLGNLIWFIAIAILASCICAATIAWGVSILKILPFNVLAIIIFINNVIIAAVLGPPLFWLVYPRVRRWGLIWTDIMEKEDISWGIQRQTGQLLMWVGALGAWSAGFFFSKQIIMMPWFANLSLTAEGAANIAAIPFLLLFIVGCLVA